ncbi:MAG: hypothetical protein NWR87_08005, partial [Rhodospirillales bacterium]|nr:hypothetical protein [Rhodospirillales bacterium]
RPVGKIQQAFLGHRPQKLINPSGVSKQRPFSFLKGRFSCGTCKSRRQITVHNQIVIGFRFWYLNFREAIAPSLERSDCYFMGDYSQSYNFEEVWRGRDYSV